MREETLKLLQHLEKEKFDFFEKRGIESGLWKLEIKITEISSDFETPRNEIIFREK